MMSTLVDALPKIGSGQPTVMVLVTGPFMPEAQRKALKSKAEKLPVRVRGVVRDPMSYFAAADLVVAMSGYNTTVELLRVGTPALLVPREGPSSEQRMRAQRFAERGWVSQLDPRELAPDLLAAVMREALSAGRRQPTAPADLAGLGRAVEHLHSAALAARAPSRISPRPPAAVKLWD